MINLVSVNLESKDGGVVRSFAPSTRVAWAEIPASKPCVAWVCCWFSPLLREVFLRVLLRFSPLLKTNIFKSQFEQESGGGRATMWMCYLENRYYGVLLLLFVIVIGNGEIKGKQPGDDIMMHKQCFWPLLHALPAELYPTTSFKKEGLSQD